MILIQLLMVKELLLAASSTRCVMGGNVTGQGCVHKVTKALFPSKFR